MAHHNWFSMELVLELTVYGTSLSVGVSEKASITILKIVTVFYVLTMNRMMRFTLLASAVVLTLREVLQGYSIIVVFSGLNISIKLIQKNPVLELINYIEVVKTSINPELKFQNNSGMIFV
jgi:hypothetical protein